MADEAVADPFACPYCGQMLFRSVASGERLKASTSILVVHQSGQVEINCRVCKHGVIVPLVLADGPFALRKSEPRYVVGLTARDMPRQE